MARWEIKRKEWELALVFRMWDEKLAIFPPYVTSRNMLGGKDMEILKEYADGNKPTWEAPNYCTRCLNGPPVYCQTCEKKRAVGAKRDRRRQFRAMQAQVHSIHRGKLLDHDDKQATYET
ncbi:MAG: hypothetical protein M1835_006006 [Candelina submexicana]|nr:MAG: hypothetical protein M1835_006006 [Candelina submexicana]